ncbi:ACSL4, partial [Symbiodinium sp. KB8]
MNKIRGTISSRVEKAGGLKKVLFNWGFNAKAKALKKGGSTPFWDRLLFDKIRTAALGGRTRLIVSGGGPLSGDVQRFMNVVFCCPVGQGYGLTETCAASSIVWADDRNVGRVGPPLLVNDIKLIDWPEGGYFSDKSGSGFPEGEVCIAGDNISLGYYAQPDLTREVYVTDKDGRRWFRTGDIGRIHPDGVLQIIDRKKDLVKELAEDNAVKNYLLEKMA